MKGLQFFKLSQGLPDLGIHMTRPLRKDYLVKCHLQDSFHLQVLGKRECLYQPRLYRTCRSSRHARGFLSLILSSLIYFEQIWSSLSVWSILAVILLVICLYKISILIHCRVILYRDNDTFISGNGDTILDNVYKNKKDPYLLNNYASTKIIMNCTSGMLNVSKS